MLPPTNTHDFRWDESVEISHDFLAVGEEQFGKVPGTVPGASILPYGMRLHRFVINERTRRAPPKPRGRRQT